MPLIDRYDSVIILLLLRILLAAACYTDVRYGRIYNALTLPGILAGITVNAAMTGSHGLIKSISAVGLVFILSLLVAPVSCIGGGDCKLVMTVAAFTGLRFTIWAMFFAMMVGGVMSVIVMAMHKILISTVRRIIAKIHISIVMKRPLGLACWASGVKFPYSPAIAIGTLITFLLLGLR